MQDIVSTTVSLEHTHALPHSQYSGNFLGALHASQRHFPHSRQMMESDWSLPIAEFKGNEGNVEIGLGKEASNVLIKLNRLLLLDNWCSWWFSDIEDDTEEL